MAFVLLESCVGLIELLLQDQHILLVLFDLNRHLLDDALLLAQDLNGLSMILLLRVEFDLNVAKMRFQLGDGTTSSDNGIGFNFLKTN